MGQQRIEGLFLVSLRLAALVVLVILGTVVGSVVWNGIPVISWEFITSGPRDGMRTGGILPALVGTMYVVLFTILLAVPQGMFAAIYLYEYAGDSRVTRLVRFAIRNLAGVPSVVFGLFGVGFFVLLLGLGTSLASAGLTLALLTLPVTVTASDEALRAVPKSYRDAALALGASRWQVIRTVVLPEALPGMLTGTILGLARAAGETAPIMFTGVALFLPRLPRSVLDQFMALPYHLYILVTQHQAIEEVRPLAYGTALVLLVLVAGLNLVAVFLRARFRRTRVI